MRTIRVDLRLSPEESTRLDRLAAILRRSRTDAAREAISQCLAHEMARLPAMSVSSLPPMERAETIDWGRVTKSAGPMVPERVYVLDEETVTADSAGGTRPVAGEVKGVERKASRLEVAKALNEAAQRAVGLEPVREEFRIEKLPASTFPVMTPGEVEEALDEENPFE